MLSANPVGLNLPKQQSFTSLFHPNADELVAQVNKETDIAHTNFRSGRSFGLVLGIPIGLLAAGAIAGAIFLYNKYAGG